MKILMAVLLIGLLFLSTSSVYAETAGEYLQNGNDSLNEGDFDQAIFDYTKALDINPNIAKAYDNRGVAYALRGYPAPAIADFTMAIANDPKDAEAYNNRGHAYAQKDNLTQAIADYTKAIDINTFYVKAYNNRELAFYMMKEYDKAWSDVHTVEKIGGAIDSNFIETLRKASGKVQ
jgi:tetratricopeptide (TPR) repeat protein